MGVAEHREQRLSVAMVDRIIAPDAAGDIAAVEPEELVQLGAREIQGAARAAKIAERQTVALLPIIARSSFDRCHNFDHFRLASSRLAG